jgi:CHASE1-domain containing sensor protein
MRLRISLPWSVLAGSLALTAAVAWWMHGIERSESTSRFERMVNARVGDLDTSVDHFEVYLRGIGGLVASSSRVNQQEWATYIGSLELSSRRDPFVSFGYAPLIEAREVPAFVAAMRRANPGFNPDPAPAPGRARGGAAPVRGRIMRGLASREDF